MPLIRITLCYPAIVHQWFHQGVSYQMTTQTSSLSIGLLNRSVPVHHYVILNGLPLLKLISSSAGLVIYRKVAMMRSTPFLNVISFVVDAEQQEILELILRNLDEAELYYLRALLMVSSSLLFIVYISARGLTSQAKPTIAIIIMLFYCSFASTGITLLTCQNISLKEY